MIEEKFSPKREALFKKLKEDIATELPGFITLLCPTKWAVRYGSLQSAIYNWNVLKELQDQCLETNLEPDIKDLIIEVKHQMGTFHYFYDENLGGMSLKYSNNLSP